MKKSSKGFTLIELLAVIVILAVIALIATPIVVELIKNSRIAAAENATHGIMKAAEVYYGEVVLANQGVYYENSTTKFDFSLTSDASGSDADGWLLLTPNGRIKYDGTQAHGGQLTIDRYGKIVITDALEINNYYCAYKPGTAATNKIVKCAEAEASVETGTPEVYTVE